MTWQMADSLDRQPNVTLTTNTEVRDLERNDDGTWRVIVHNLESDETESVNARHVFNGAGGAALLLLQKSGIPEASPKPTFRWAAPSCKQSTPM
ncbi:malate:quinone oxidoreductase [Pseudomonas profundi]|uniref:malate:quinone oxidoreductase n=1 Tax=Pseudomonas profundi TaxID=1981513 RepID=UPI0029587A90|nr:malate:quinone oxidoreductase [Pseudomonas profundi]